MIDRLEVIRQRYNQIGEQLTDPNIVSDIKKMTALSKEQRSLEKVVNKYEELIKLQKDIEDLKEMVNDSDLEIQQMAEIELEEAQLKLPRLEEEIKILLLPKDPNDEKMLLLKLEVLQAVMKEIFLQVTYLECISNMLKLKDGR